MIESNRLEGAMPRSRASFMLMAGRALASVLASITIAHATSFDYADSSDDRLPFHPGHFVFDADGAWVTGNATVRYNTDGTVAIVSGVAPFGDALLAGTPDGGVAEALAPFELSKHLSANRTQGVPNMIALVKQTAERYAAAA